jgi:hypothetical protein
VRGLAIARTMGIVMFALFLLFFSIESKDQRDSAFSLDTFSDKTFAAAALSIVAAVEICRTVLRRTAAKAIHHPARGPRAGATAPERRAGA